MRFIDLVFIALLLSCTKEKDFVPVYNVPDEFQPFVESFIQEAAARGFTFEIENLIIKYDESLDNAYCGMCNAAQRTNDVQKIISINPNIQCWDNIEEKENLVFHELGHCILGRAHNNELFPKGFPKSIMIKDNNKLYSPCDYDIDGNNTCDYLIKRAYYLDELFDEGTPMPDWAK